MEIEDIKTFCAEELIKYEMAYNREFLHPPFEVIDTQFLTGMMVAYEKVIKFIEHR
jgi:hypothetical protein